MHIWDPFGKIIGLFGRKPILAKPKYGKFKRFDMQLIWYQNLCNTFQKFNKTISLSLVGSKPSANHSCLTKTLAWSIF